MVKSDEDEKRRITWEDAVRDYPNMWVVFKNTEKSGANPISGILVDVKSDDEIIPYKVANHQNGYDFYRTTEEQCGVLKDVDFRIRID